MENEKIPEMVAVFNYSLKAIEKALLEYHTKRITFAEENYFIEVALPDSVNLDYRVIVIQKEHQTKIPFWEHIKNFLRIPNKNRLISTEVC
jgi:hypothetical protein